MKTVHPSPFLTVLPPPGLYFSDENERLREENRELTEDVDELDAENLKLKADLNAYLDSNPEAKEADSRFQTLKVPHPTIEYIAPVF